jgi:hypothetical protein
MTKTFRSRALLDAARDQPCVRCGAIGTTVAAHLNSVAHGKGMGIKTPDFFTAWLCNRCHDLIDGRVPGLTPAQRYEQWLEAYLRTVEQWFRQGIVTVK